MVNVAEVRDMEGDINATADGLGLQIDELTDVEVTRLLRSFERQFVVEGTQRALIDIYRRHLPEIVLGAKVAKKQMSAEIGGQEPGPGKIGGPIPIRAGFFGIGDDWTDIRGIYSAAQDAWTTGAPQDWIHSGTTMMGGVDGNPVKIGANGVHVVFGVGSLHPNPKLESVKFTINGREKPVYNTWFQQKVNSTLKVAEFDKAFLFAKGDTVLAEVFYSAAIGGAVALSGDYPFLLGASFVKEPQMRLQDPADLDGTTQDLIMVV